MSTPQLSADGEALLGRALAAIDALQARLDQLQAAAREPIAIVGLGCRFPGADGPSEFLEFLRRGGDAIGPVPAARAAAFAGVPPALRMGGFLPDVAGFDAAFFGLRAEEARAMDPQQRLLLEVAWQALDDACAAGGELAGTRTGVYLGLGAQSADYAWGQLAAPAGAGPHAIGGSFHSLMPGRLSYLLDLRGPSLVVDAACASGLAVVHLACEALRRGECDAAIAAAVNLVLSPLVSRAVAASGLWSPTGCSRAFDAQADGFVRGEGGGAVLLMRLSDAQRAGHAIHALLPGSACAQDGRSNGLTAPSGPAQVAVIRAALRAAGLTPSQVHYVEAHASGTRLGDAIEAQALADAYGEGRAQALAVGALKPALGHLESAAGMAALIKAVLAVEHEWLPPTLHHAQASADVAAVSAQVRIVTQPEAWTAGPRMAGVSAFGMSGTNAHVLVAQAPAATPTLADAEQAPCPPCTLHLSAATPAALAAFAGRLAEAPLPSWPALCDAIAHGRKAFPLAVALRAASLAEGRTLLRAVARGERLAQPVAESAAPTGTEAPRTRLRLPAYPWDRQHYWLDDEAEPVPPMRVEQPVWHPAPPRGAHAVPPDGAWRLFGQGRLARRCATALAAAGPACKLEDPWRAPAPSAGSTRAHWLWCLPEAAADEAPARRVTRVLQTLAVLVRLRLDDAGTAGAMLLLTPPSDGNDAAAAAAGAFWRVAAAEHPELIWRHLEFDDTEGLADTALAPACLDPAAAPWLRLRSDGTRAVPGRASISANSGPWRLLDPRGACLITGAFGGVGPALADWLVARGARDLVLVGRHPRPLPQQRAWQPAGVRVRCVAADVADAATMSQALAELRADGVPLIAVFHAAGLTADGLVAQLPAERYAEVLRPKLEGALLLDRLCRGPQLQAFVLFSSITAQIPLAGTAAYAAANASLDTIARQRRAEGLPALCVQWGTWGDAGMAERAGTALAAQWRAHGIHPFTPAEGLAALEALLASDAICAMAGRFDWSAVQRQQALLQGRAPALPVATGASVAPPTAAPAAMRPPVQPALDDPAALERLVRQEVAGVLGLAVDDPRLALGFGEIGLASLAAVELKSRLAQRLGIAVPATLAFNHPSVAAVAAFLARRLRAAAASAPVQAEAGLTTP